MPEIPLAEQIAALRRVLADMEQVKRGTPAWDRLVLATRAALETLESLNNRDRNDR